MDGRWPAILRGLLLSVVLILLAVNVLDVIRGPWDHDGGYYLTRAAIVAAGYQPYLDYASIYPPLMELLHAIPVALGIDRYALAIALPLLWIVASSVMSAVLARRLGCGPNGSFAAAIGFLIMSIENGGNHVTLEHGVVFFSLLAMSILARPGAIGRAALFSCGAALAAAILTKQNGIVTALPIGVMLFERRRELSRASYASFLSGVAAPFVLLLAWLDFEVVRIANNVVELLMAYASGGSHPMRSFYWEYFRSAPTALFLVLVPAAGVVAIASRRHRLLAIVALAGAVVQFLPRIVRDYSHYTINMWPFALLVLVLAAHSSADGMGRLTRASIATGLAVSLLVMGLSQSVERWSKPGMLPSTFLPAAESLRRLSAPETRVRQYGSESIIEFLAGRLPGQFDTPTSAFSGVWDGRHLVPEPLPTGIPVVLVDRGASWVPPLRARLEAAGFRADFDHRARRDFRVTVYSEPREPKR